MGPANKSRDDNCGMARDRAKTRARVGPCLRRDDEVERIKCVGFIKVLCASFPQLQRHGRVGGHPRHVATHAASMHIFDAVQNTIARRSPTKSGMTKWVGRGRGAGWSGRSLRRACRGGRTRSGRSLSRRFGLVEACASVLASR